MVLFVGRDAELATLSRMMQRVREDARSGRPGKALLIRGRRRVGKSRLVEEFVERADVPLFFFTASLQASAAADLRSFTEELRASSFPDAALADGQEPASWDAALRLLAATVPQDGPSIVVIDELPYLIRNDPGFEGALQKVFDRELSRKPVLLIGVGSDLGMMEALNEYGRPFHQRATEMVVLPLSPRAVASLLDVGPAEAFDAYLVTGGLPLILGEWPSGARLKDYLQKAVPDPTSALIVSGERSLAAEFPPMTQPRSVVEAIGAGERTFSLIAREAGFGGTSLTRALDILAAKRVVKAELPLSTKPSRESRYTVDDPHLRFWLSLIGPYLHEIERGRGDLTLARIGSSWTSWRGRAIEPVVREALMRLPERLPEGSRTVGGYWTRSNNPEVDIIGADRPAPARRITMVGSIKWHESRAFDSHDLAQLLRHRDQVPGAHADTPLLAVSRSGSVVPELDCLTAADLLVAWDQRDERPSSIGQESLD